MIEITLLPLLTDNYAYFLEEKGSGITAVVDPSEGAGVLSFLKRHKKSLTYIFNTHHHPDHTGGNLALKQETGAQVVGFEKDAVRLPGLDHGLKEGDIFTFGASKIEVIFVPGHTSGHIAYFCPQEKALFSGDTLFSLGCGRLFEGSAEEMWASLSKLMVLPDETQIYCGHEYTLLNLEFAKYLFPEDRELLPDEIRLRELRASSHPTIPSLMKFEKRFNPFLLFQKRPCEEGLSDVEIFALRRRLKDEF